MIFTEEQLTENHLKFIETIKLTCGDRSDLLLKMYSDLEYSLKYSPASSYKHLHNAFKGGYIDHVLRVLEFTFQVYDTWSRNGLDVSNFTPDELAFAALHHDLGKLGFPHPELSRYVDNESEWHRENLGKDYNINDYIPFTLIQHQSLFLLQLYGIKVSFNEYLAIMTHDGLYDEVNKPYLLAKSVESKMRCNISYILHQGDFLAAQFEYERWKSVDKPWLLNNTNT